MLIRNSRAPFFAHLWSVLAVAGLFLGCASPAAHPGATPAPAIRLAACQLSMPGTSARHDAQCGNLTVYENRTVQSGRQIQLHIAVLPAVSRSPARDPLFFLAGGPGQAATESYLPLSSAFDRINQNRDIVLVDQRGTGQSHPLRCPTPQADEDLAADTDDQLAGWARACLDQLEADPRLYTTSLAMDDLDQVRAALGYDRINLYGVSYGTRAALTYLRQHPDHVRAAVLDGIAPPDWPVGLTAARDAQRALDLIFDRCASDPGCQEAFPNLRAEFEALLASLAQRPAQVTVPDPVSGAPVDVTLTRQKAATTVRLLSYLPETAGLLPLLVHATQAQGDYHLLAAQYLMVKENLAQSISDGMYYSVVCAEDGPYISPGAAAEASAGTYLGNGATEAMLRLCAVWPRAETPPGTREPVTSDVPVLLLSGQADPVTPPSNGDAAARTLSRSLHLVAPGQGHNVVYRGCLPKIATAFIESGTIEGLDAGCVQQIQPMPFFLDFTGPQP